MAKSLRSKWVRKMKAIKRIRYGEKEKARLVNMLNSAKAAQDEASPESQFIQVRPPNKTPGEVETDVTMAELPKYDPKTLKDEHGNYPVWMNQRRIRKQKKIVTKKNKRKNNKQSKRV